MDDLIVAGTNHERALTALGAYQAFLRNDSALLVEYRRTFSASYMEYGFVGMLGALVASMENYSEFLILERNHIKANRSDDTTHAAGVIATLTAIMDGAAHWVTPVHTAMGEPAFLAYLTIGRRALAAAAYENHGTPEELLARLQKLTLMAVASGG